MRALWVPASDPDGWRERPATAIVQRTTGILEMAMLRPLLIAACLAGLLGCATPPAGTSDALPWRDQAFGYQPGLVDVAREDLFRLDPDLLARVQAPIPVELSPSQKLNHLLVLVFGPDKRRFTYAGGHSTTASETWRRQRGDCLSLTMLTYAVARVMGMPVQMQEVDTPVLFERRDGFDFVNQHVNVLFRRAQWSPNDESRPHDVVVDFEPDFASPRPGRPLDEDGIHARFLNNRAVEHLAAGELALAYAHFRAAVAADPRYAASYANLALLYRQASLPQEAEQLLQRAVALASQDDVVLHGLQQLLAEQGRDGEARRYESILQAHRSRDPYHWIAQGVRALENGEPRKAVRALEQARGMTGNFREVHALLALAYWRVGEPARAQQELDTLAGLGVPERSVAKLRRKFN
jgi:Tfp pilus assembly protein PilF